MAKTSLGKVERSLYKTTEAFQSIGKGSRSLDLIGTFSREAPIVLQLKSAAEKRATHLWHTARLSPHNPVAILLHCIEKSTIVVQCWDENDPGARDMKDFTSQGDETAEALRIFFKHRDILPEVYQKEDGNTASGFSYGMSHSLIGAILHCKNLISWVGMSKYVVDTYVFRDSYDFDENKSAC